MPLLPVRRTLHAELLPRVWELRGDVTAHDAVCVALADHVDVPLVTGDAKLQRGSGALQLRRGDPLTVLLPCRAVPWQVRS